MRRKNSDKVHGFQIFEQKSDTQKLTARFRQNRKTIRSVFFVLFSNLHISLILDNFQSGFKNWEAEKDDSKDSYYQ